MFIVVHEKKINKGIPFTEYNLIDHSVNEEFAYNLLEKYVKSLPLCKKYFTRMKNHKIIEAITLNECIKVSEIKENELIELIKIKNLIKDIDDTD